MTQEKSNRLKGQLGEDQGERYLKSQGYQILERNVRSPFGEIDIIASHQNYLVFVEIKSRQNDLFGLPEEAVGKRKQMKLAKLASWYLSRYSKFPQVRFDVLAIQSQGSESGIRLIHNAFEI